MAEESKKTSSNRMSNDIEPQSAVRLSQRIQCWAHTRSGQRCQATVRSREGEPVPIPYCNLHLKHGDGVLKVAKHPFAGRCLVARFELPAGYRLLFHGIRGKCAPSNLEDRSLSYYPPNPKTGSNHFRDQDGSRQRKINNYNGVLNPENTGDLLQFASCPGPSERQNVQSKFRYFGVRNGRLGGLEFVTTEKIPRNTQICFSYGPGWWSARGTKRRDVGTAKYPAPKRRARAKGRPPS